MKELDFNKQGGGTISNMCFARRQHLVIDNFGNPIHNLFISPQGFAPWSTRKFIPRS